MLRRKREKCQPGTVLVVLVLLALNVRCSIEVRVGHGSELAVRRHAC